MSKLKYDTFDYVDGEYISPAKVTKVYELKDGLIYTLPAYFEYYESPGQLSLF